MVPANPANPVSSAKPHRRTALLQVDLTAEDLLLTRFRPAPAPLIEAVAGLIAIRRRPQSGLAMRVAFPATARPLLDLTGGGPPWPAFTMPRTSGLEESLEVVRATPRSTLRTAIPGTWTGPGHPPAWIRALANGEPEALQTVVQALRDFFRAFVEPNWPSIAASFRAEVAERTAILATHGLGSMLGTLHQELTWRDATLTRRARSAVQMSLGGAGLELLPSASWTGPPLFVYPCAPGQTAVLLLYSASRPAVLQDSAKPHDLAGVLGYTRATVLQALRIPQGTSELAACVRISAASASVHARALRESGLVRTVRAGRQVRHSLTPLGRNLLDGYQPLAAPGEGLPS